MPLGLSHPGVWAVVLLRVLVAGGMCQWESGSFRMKASPTLALAEAGSDCSGNNLSFF